MKFTLVTVLVLVVVAVVEADWSIELSNKKLNCHKVQLESFSQLLENPSNACNKIKELAKNPEERYEQNALEILAMIDDCLCNIVPRETVWQTILNKDVQRLYSAVVKTNIRATPKDKIRAHNEVSFFKQFDANMDFNLPYMKKMLKEEVEIPVGPGKMWSSLEARDEASIAFLKKTCGHLAWAGSEFLEIFKAAASLSNNKNLVYQLTAYDKNMFMVMVASKGCLMMDK